MRERTPSASLFVRILNGLGLHELAAPEARRLLWLWLALGVLAVVLRAIFWGYTHRMFEDAAIALRHAENAVAGLGLTHHASEPRVQGFSSPLGVLLPLLGEAFHTGFGLPLIKVVSLLGAPIAILYLAALAAHGRLRLAWPLAGMAMGYAAIEHHQILYGMAGMETQLATAALLASLYYAMTAQPGRLGVALGLCLLARPEYAVWGLLAGLSMLRRGGRAFGKTVAAGTAVYGPWLVFATLYYGSPVPNTVVAKGMAFPQWWLDPGLTWLDFKRDLVDRTLATFSMLGPSWNAYPFPGYGYLLPAVLTLAVIGAVGALRKDHRPQLLMVLLWGVLTAYAVFLVRYRCPYYLAPLMTVTALLGAHGLDLLLSPLRGRGKSVTGGLAGGLAGLAYLGCLASALPHTFFADRSVQTHIEDGVRKPVGLFLREAMKPDEAFTCEPVGYLGYYAQRTSYDWPGLTSRRVTDHLRAHPEDRSLCGVAAHFRPAYLVLRPSECDTLRADPRGNWLDQEYALCKTFEVPPNTAPGWLYDNYDARFLIFKKR